MPSFTCGECGRDRLDLTSETIPAAGLCVACICQPLWFRDPDMKDRLAPDHDGVEVVERRMPHLTELRT